MRDVFNGASVPEASPGDAYTEASRLQVLAHPLRLRMLGLLRVEGPSTATRLGRRCGQSSGVASYHLRQLASAGFIVEAEPVDLTGLDLHARDRWWKAASEVTVAKSAPEGDEAGVAADADYDRAVIELYAERVRAWVAAKHKWPQQWQAWSSLGDRVLFLTPAQATALQADFKHLLARYRQHSPTRTPPPDDSRADQLAFALQYQFFPDPEQVPPDAGASGEAP